MYWKIFHKKWKLFLIINQCKLEPTKLEVIFHFKWAESNFMKPLLELLKKQAWLINWFMKILQKWRWKRGKISIWDIKLKLILLVWCFIFATVNSLVWILNNHILIKRNMWMNGSDLYRKNILGLYIYCM